MERCNKTCRGLAVLLAVFIAVGATIAIGHSNRQRLVRQLIGQDEQFVVRRLGLPFLRYDNPEDFNRLQTVMRDEGMPLYRDVVPAKGQVWLYKSTSTRCLTIYFNRGVVERVFTTHWPTLPDKQPNVRDSEPR
jgi:hypothetical protein